jgi:hypothetical protein
MYACMQLAIGHRLLFVCFLFYRRLHFSPLSLWIPQPTVRLAGPLISHATDDRQFTRQSSGPMLQA